MLRDVTAGDGERAGGVAGEFPGGEHARAGTGFEH
jgi:hypothetical protein